MQRIKLSDDMLKVELTSERLIFNIVFILQFYFLRPPPMKPDFTCRNATLKPKSKQFRNLKEYLKGRQGRLEERQSMCMFVRMLQKEERGCFEEEIQRERQKASNDYQSHRKRISFSLNGSIFQPNRPSRCIIHAQNQKTVLQSYAHKEIKKNLIIKNLQILSSPINQYLHQAHSNHKFTTDEPVKADSNQRPTNLQMQKRWVNRLEKERNYNVRIRDSLKMKTEGDITTLTIDSRQIRKKTLLRMQDSQSSFAKLNKIRIELSKNMVSKLPCYKKSQIFTEVDDEINEMEKSLLRHQNEYLKIKRLPNKVNGNQLFQTQVPKPDDLEDSPTFRKYSETSQL